MARSFIELQRASSSFIELHQASMEPSCPPLMLWMIGNAHGVVMMTSASTNSLSNLEFSPSLSDVVTKVWPWSSSHFRMPSSFSVVPSISGTSRACSPPSYRTSRTYGGQDQKGRFSVVGGDQMELPCPVVVQSLLACVPRQSAGTGKSQPECGSKREGRRQGGTVSRRSEEIPF